MTGGAGESMQLERQHAVSHDDSGSRHNGDSASDAVLTSSSSHRPVSPADSLPSHHQPPVTMDFATVSLDDAWKSLSMTAVPANSKHRRHVRYALSFHFVGA